MYLFSELPDSDDINTQVLLLGITRFETTPSPVPSAKHLLSSSGNNSIKYKRTIDTKLNTFNENSSIIFNDINFYESIEQLNSKSTGCFPLDRHKVKKTTYNTIPHKKPTTAANAYAVTNDKIYADGTSYKSQDIQLIEQKSHRKHFDRLFDRFQRKRIHHQQKHLSVNRSQHRNSIEQKAFYHWLHLKRNNRLERNVKCIKDADVNDIVTDRQSLYTPVIRKCSTKSNSIRKKVTKKSTKLSASSSNFNSCIPYCVAAFRNDSITGNSLASSHRSEEYLRKYSTSASASNDRHRHHRFPTSTDCSMHSHCKSNKHSSPSNKNDNNNSNTDNNYNNNCSLFNNLNIMDRSVDSIGSCSLDVDAESTDFSDTSGSLNVCTPLSGKDFTREFTSRIHERCQFPLSGQKFQQTKTVLDPNSGKISTILSQNVSSTINSPTSPVKKPSYLNLACCVNGYSNLTTYDSKFRQSINKSREVSPIRPITYTVQYNRNGDNNYLSIPTIVPINDNAKNSMMDAHSILTPDKRYFSTATQQKAIELNGTNHDVTDNVSSNGCAKYFARSTNGSGNTSLALVLDVNQECDANGKGTAKSFIQQRVERLYGPAAVTQGLYSPKKPKSTDNNNQDASMRTTTTISSVLVEKSQNSTNTTTFQSTKYVMEAQRNGHLNGLSNIHSAHDDENINLNSLNEALPVLRHLRPEFRAQLPTLSPKRTVAISKLTPSLQQSKTTITASASLEQPLSYTNGTAVNGKLNISTNILNKVTNGGGVVSPTTVPNIIDESNRFTLDSQLHKQYQSSASTTLASVSTTLSASIEKTKNDCLTSNKSHDIEIDRRDKLIESPTTNSSSSSSATQIDTQNTSKLLATNDKQDSNIVQVKREQSNCLIESPIHPVKMYQIPAIDQSSGGGSGSIIGDTTKIKMNSTNKKSVETMDANGNHETEQKKDAHYYLNVVQSERDRLINMAIVAEKELDELLEKGNVDEEVLGHIRSAAGKARLLATKKFKQFEGLCTDSINQITREMPPPTPADLQGFWEMVLLQVDNVDSLYAELDKIRANGWKKPTQAKPKQPQGSRLTKRPLAACKTGATSTAQSASGTTKKSAVAIAAAQKREAQRKQLAEMRRKNKLAMATHSASDEVIVNQVSENPSSQSNNDENNTENETER